MEFNKITNFLGDSNDKVPRFTTKKWIKVNPQSTKDFKPNKEIKFKTSMLRSDLCDYSEAYVWVKGNVNAIDSSSYRNTIQKSFDFKNNVPFLSCISKINGEQVENAEDLDVVMPMYNLLEYGKNYQKTSGSLFNYHRDEPNSGSDGDTMTISFLNSKSFDYKSSLHDKLPLFDNNDDNNEGKQVVTVNNLGVAVPLKYLGNFWRNLNIPLINCEISLSLSWSEDCVLSNREYEPVRTGNPKVINFPSEVKFEIKDCKLYVPVVTLSTENENKLFEMLKSGFKGTVKWNKYMSYISNEAKNSNLNYLIDPTFEKVNRLFVLSFENEDDRTSYHEYYVPNVEIKNYNALIDGNPFFELHVKYIEETYENILQTSDDNGYYTRGDLLDYNYFKEHYKMIAIDLSKQIELENKDTKHQINFIGSLDRDEGATMFFIIEKQEETVIEFLQNYASIV